MAVQNKNLFDKDNSNILNYYMTSTGTIGASVFDKLFYINCNPSTTYTIQKIIGTSGRFRIGSFANIPSVGDEPNVFVARDNQTTGVITTGVNDKYLAVQYFASDSNEQAILDSIQVEKRQEKTDYIKGRLQTFTFPLGNEKLMLGDYLADDGIHHVRGQDVFDGSNDENWNYEELSYGNNFYINISNAKGEDEIPILSNYFKYYERGRLEPDYSCKISRFKNLNLRHQDFTNTSDFKTWLSTHNTIVEYLLEEEVIVPYTSAQQEVYNQIKQAISYEEQTNISSNQNALFSVEAYQSTKLVLKEMATAIVALGGV